MSNASTARVVFLVTVPESRQPDFLDAYERIRYLVAASAPGHVVDQLCQSPDDPEQWLITSEWHDLGSFLAWERSDEHREMVRPLRDCVVAARSLRFNVVAETRTQPEAAVAGAGGELR